MTKRDKLLLKIKNNSNNVRFDELCHLIETFGFIHSGGKGSHRFYTYKGIPGVLNVQDYNGMAKPYQVKQFLKIIEEFKLKVV